ncbi:hypothetical protein CYLTODRAFT_470429 [Cylindrobasidium torrendii FP15055 ss-10]|uniref:Uncharacterized protein n=1 Tax=Cylindrobasidium torrendii FP15055 ss-10 TaxID=1314674 RepID=A0A0D7AZN7_9AGAR|nr:hypothetical protein CYLTODRAFT_470429 [Cylindrobasidium torrendii FP15055 ss-10]
MDRLGFDVLSEILCNSLLDARKASGVCRGWRGVCGPSLFKHLVIKSAHIVETAEAFLNHPELLSQTRDVSFVAIEGLSPDDVRMAVNAVQKILPQDTLERFTLRSHAYFIDCVIPPCVVSAMLHKKWKQIHFYDVKWPEKITGIRQTVRALSAEALWLEPFIELDRDTSRAGLTHVVSRLLAKADCLTLIDINTSLTFPSNRDRLSLLVGRSVRHLSIVTTCCFNYEEHFDPVDWTGFDLRNMHNLTSLWVVAGSDDLSVIRDVVRLGIPQSLASIHFELHPHGNDLDRVQLLQQAVSSHAGLQSVVFNVCLCGVAEEPLDHDDNAGLPSISQDAYRRIARQEELWRQKGASFSFVRTECTIQGLVQAGMGRWVHGQDSCMVLWALSNSKLFPFITISAKLGPQDSLTFAFLCSFPGRSIGSVLVTHIGFTSQSMSRRFNCPICLSLHREAFLDWWMGSAVWFLWRRTYATAYVGQTAATDALCAQEFKTVGINLVTTSPNMTVATSPQYGWCPIEMDTALRYGKYDPIFHPQLWRSRVPHYATIPWPSEATNISPVLWEVFTVDDFENHDQGGTLRALQLVVLRADRKQSVKEAWMQARARFRDFEDEWALGRSQILPFNDLKARGLRSTSRVIWETLETPIEVEQAIARVTTLQRALLELHGRLTWLQLQPALHNPPALPSPVRLDLMGAVVGKLEIADRFYRAGIPVWLVRDQSAMPVGWKEAAGMVFGPDDDAFRNRRETSAAGQSIWAGERDSWRPMLCVCGAGDLRRYAAMKRYLQRMCASSDWAWPKLQEWPDWVHDEYQDAVQDDELDIPDDTAATLLFLKALRPPGATLQCATSNQDQPTEEDWADFEAPLTGDHSPASGPSRSIPARVAASGSALPMSKTGLWPSRSGATGASAKFYDMPPPMPRILTGWREAAARAATGFVDNARVPENVDAKYTLPPPEFIATLSDAAVRVYLKWRPLLLLRLGLPLDKVPSLRSRAWRMVMGKGEMSKPSEKNKRGMTNWRQAESALQEAVAHFSHIEDVQMNRLEEAEPQWCGRWVMHNLSPEMRTEIAWECCEANFRFEVLRLDSYRYRLVDSLDFSCRGPAEDEYGESELDANSWDERRNKIFGIFPHWRSKCVAELSDGSDGFASTDSKVRGGAYLALWELMQTWTRGRVPPLIGSLSAVEDLKVHLHIAHESGSDLEDSVVAVAGEHVAFDVFANAGADPRGLQIGYRDTKSQRRRSPSWLQAPWRSRRWYSDAGQTLIPHPLREAVVGAASRIAFEFGRNFFKNSEGRGTVDRCATGDDDASSHKRIGFVILLLRPRTRLALGLLRLIPEAIADGHLYWRRAPAASTSKSKSKLHGLLLTRDWVGDDSFDTQYGGCTWDIRASLTSTKKNRTEWRPDGLWSREERQGSFVETKAIVAEERIRVLDWWTPGRRDTEGVEQGAKRDSQRTSSSSVWSFVHEFFVKEIRECSASCSLFWYLLNARARDHPSATAMFDDLEPHFEGRFSGRSWSSSHVVACILPFSTHADGLTTEACLTEMVATGPSSSTTRRMCAARQHTIIRMGVLSMSLGEDAPTGVLEPMSWIPKVRWQMQTGGWERSKRLR